MFETVHMALTGKVVMQWENEKFLVEIPEMRGHSSEYVTLTWKKHTPDGQEIEAIEVVEGDLPTVLEAFRQMILKVK